MFRLEKSIILHNKCISFGKNKLIIKLWNNYFYLNDNFIDKLLKQYYVSHAFK
jgi:hypothetical protein